MHRPSRRSGRISFVVLAGVLCLALVAVLFLFTGQTPRTAAMSFMTALAQGDVNKLTELSVVHNKSKEEIRKAWEDTIRNSHSYAFFWEVKSFTQNGDKATVRVDRAEHPEQAQAYEDHFELQLVKTPDGWKVDVPQIGREMYPYLPR